MKEVLVSGKYYRILVDSVNNIWHRISYWTKASDVEFEDGSRLEGKVFGHAILARSKAYKVGDIAYSNNAPSWVVPRCTKAGTTDTQEPSAYSAIQLAGTVITDGSAQFTVDDIRPATALSTSGNQTATVGLVKSSTDAAVTKANTINVYVGSDQKLHFKNAAGADTALNFKLHDQKYTLAATEKTKDLGEIHKYRNIDATNVYNKGVSDADARTNTSSANYKAGYSAGKSAGKSAGITEADGRANSSSTNYKTGYNAGVTDGRRGYYTKAQYDANYTSGYNAGVSAADGRANSSSANYKAGYDAGVAAGRQGYYTKAQYDANYNSGYNSGYNNGYSAGRGSYTKASINMQAWTGSTDSVVVNLSNGSGSVNIGGNTFAVTLS